MIHFQVGDLIISEDVFLGVTRFTYWHVVDLEVEGSVEVVNFQMDSHNTLGKRVLSDAIQAGKFTHVPVQMQQLDR